MGSLVLAPFSLAPLLKKLEAAPKCECEPTPNPWIVDAFEPRFVGLYVEPTATPIEFYDCNCLVLFVRRLTPFYWLVA